MNTTTTGKGHKAAFAMFVLMFVFALVSTTASAGPVSTISFASGDGSATSSTGNVFTITPHPAWGILPGASWVSAYENTGYGGVVLPNAPDPDHPTMTFWQDFFLPYENNWGWLIVGADDTAGVVLNGHVLKSPNWSQDGACAAGPIGCQSGEFATLDMTPYLSQGQNVLEVAVFQRGAVTSGGIWGGVATSETPEPATWAVAGLGFLLIGGLYRRQRRE